MRAEACSWCGTRVDAGDGYRLTEPLGERRAVFCRLEHVVPWAIRGAHWGTLDLPAEREAGEADGVGACSRCGTELIEPQLVLVRHRGDHRVTDRFCSVNHLLDWAKAGGRWQV